MKLWGSVQPKVSRIMLFILTIFIVMPHPSMFATQPIKPISPNPEVSPIEIDQSMSFSDIAEHWANADIVNAFDKKIIKGYPDGTFRPDEFVTRSEFAVMLMDAYNFGGVSMVSSLTLLPFKDKSKIEPWAVQSISKAVRLGIINGYPDGTFRPQDNITHAEMMELIILMVSLVKDKLAPTGYADDETIPAWARGAAALSGKLGLLGGIVDNKFAPNASSTRAQAVAAIVRALDIYMLQFTR
ncbi:S-layer homology domain-containing protein [Cohnella sp. WQ 127256]|uniref:S-layer homology domain-containing protein n=1 Tax=Cohnella sp. WQ 127256 TaxID=2938790 RepID=UPI0021199913|nr:S-layer homology domain-containing protein [Cohnella sp. WQ 127256]